MQIPKNNSNMRKKVISCLIAILAIGVGTVALTMTSTEAVACTKCNTKDESRKCGNCKSHRLWSKRSWTADNGRLRTQWECEDCKHSFITERRNGREVVL